MKKALASLLLSFSLMSAASTPAALTSWELTTDSTQNAKMVEISKSIIITLAQYPALTTTQVLPSKFVGGAISYCHGLPATVPAARMPKPTWTITQPTATTSGSITVTRAAYTTAEVTNIINAQKQNQKILYQINVGCQIN